MIRTEEPGVVTLEEIDDSGRLLEEIPHGLPDDASGDDMAGGSAPTPDQDLVDEIGRAIGITYQEGEPLRVGWKEEERDEHRWELDPASAEDYAERTREEAKRLK